MRRCASWLRSRPSRMPGRAAASSPCLIYGMQDGLLRDLGPTLASAAERDSLISMDERVRKPIEPLSGVRRHAIAAFSLRRPGDGAG